MVIKPYGYAIWEKMQAELDKMFKETGHQNASEAIIWNTFRGWVQSYRDLPLLINQWANVVRWEMRTRLFLRTAEFLWQEGHTAHETKKEALAEAELMNNVYATFVEKFMAIPVIQGLKTESERFAGADETYCIEALMQDGKALQAGTSHFLGQNFAKAFDVKFANKEGKQDYVWATSWGVSTRLMGALIMTHSDDHGLVLPPSLAPNQVVIVPIYKTEEDLNAITEVANTILSDLRAKHITVKFDNRTTHRPGAKFAQHELQGVPLRIAIGARDLANGTVEIARRDTLTKQVVALDNLNAIVEGLLKEIQESLFKKALDFRDEHITEVDTFDEFKTVLETKTGFISAHWDGTNETEDKIKALTKATIRCVPLEGKHGFHPCKRGSIPLRATIKKLRKNKMANHKSALKRIRSNEAKRLTNKYQHKTTRNAIKKLRELTDKKEAETMFPSVVSMLDRLAKKNVIHANKAANLKSGLAKHIAAL